MTEKTNSEKNVKKAPANPLDLATERDAYRTRRILGFWHSAAGPIFEQVLGSDLARELNARLETANPWRDDREDRKEGESAFICRLSHQCAGVLAVIETLSTRPEEMSIETALDAMGRTAPNNEIRRMLAAMVELGPQRLMDAGVVEFCDTVEAIHADAHGGVSPAMILLDIIRLGR